MQIFNSIGSSLQLTTIKMLCAIKGISVPEREAEKIENLVSQNISFILFLNVDETEIFPVRGRSSLLAKMVSFRVSRGNGIVILVNHGIVTEINKKNLATKYALIAEKVAEISDDKEEIRYNKRTFFDDAMPERVHKKASRQGFLRTLNANVSMEFISPLTSLSLKA